MDEHAVRRLAGELLAALPSEFPDAAERTRVAAAITDALEAPQEQVRKELLAVLSAHPATRRWMREHGAMEDALRVSLPGNVSMAGNSTGQPALYYVCPDEDEDAILLRQPAEPPLCSVHRIPMILQQD